MLSFTGDSVEKMIVQNEILKSSANWMIVYFWRLLNPHNVMQFILVSILYGKMFEYVSTIQFLGFLPIAFTGLLSFVYSKYAISAIASAA